MLNDLPENEIEVIYSFVQFLTSKQTAEKIVDTESLEDILNKIVGAVPDTGKTLEEYRKERLKGRYENVD